MEQQLKAGNADLQGRKDKLSKEIGAVVDEATGLAKDVGAQGLESARSTLSQTQDALTGGAKRYANLTDEYVRSHPWKLLGAAAGAGLLIGLLISRH